MQSNNWGVSYSRITWLERFLRGHDNISSFTRDRDILITANRKIQGDVVKILILDEYTLGLPKVVKALEEFEGVNIIYIGGGWCSYTMQAKEFAIQKNIGIYVTDEMTGALFRDDFWNYHKKDRDGNPEYFSK